MGTTPTETLSVAGNIFVGQVRSWAGDPAPQPLQLTLPWRKGLLLPSQETCGPAWPCLEDNRVFSLADRSPAAHPPVPCRHDPFRNPRCHDWWLFHHCRQCDGCLHILWGECTSRCMPHAPCYGVLTHQNCPGLAGGRRPPSSVPWSPSISRLRAGCLHVQLLLAWPKPRSPAR